MTFRERLFATVAAARAVIEEPGVLIVGSEVPNFLEPRSASTLIVSQDLDIGVPIDRHAAVKSRLGGLHDFRSAEEPSVWLPRGGGLLELRQEGFRVDPVGREVDPPKTIVIAPAQRVAALASARAVPVIFGSELLSATCLVLVPFDPL